jgi:RNA polymerase sigma-70 factor (ECF subfamily)
MSQMPLTDPPADGDHALLARLQAGDGEALGELYDRYHDRVYRLARVLCRDDEQADEAVRETFLSLWRDRGSYRRDVGSISAWLLTLLRHRANDARDLPTMLARLPEAEREVITLAYYGRLTHTEIAAQLSLPSGTVKGRLRRGLQKLRTATTAPE